MARPESGAARELQDPAPQGGHPKRGEDEGNLSIPLRTVCRAAVVPSFPEEPLVVLVRSRPIVRNLFRHEPGVVSVVHHGNAAASWARATRRCRP